MRNITLVPAYGRDYKNKAEVMIDWNANKDFIIMDVFLGGAVNKEQIADLKEQGVNVLNIRFKKLQNVTVIKI